MIREKKSKDSAIQRKRLGLMIDPRKSKYIPYWDFVTSFALIYVCLVTPYEVGFLGSPTSWTDSLFLINRFVDAIFIAGQGDPGLALLAAVGFPLTLLFQRVVPGT